MKIVAVFPYSGDTEFVRNNRDYLVDARKSESSPLAVTVAIDDVKNAVQQNLPVIVYASPRVLNALEDYQLDYYLVYPSAECKDEWVARAKATDKTFASYADRLWDTLLDDMYRRRRARPLVLGSGMTISDVLEIQDGTLKLKD